VTPDEGVPTYPAGHPIAAGYTVISLLRRGDALDVYQVWSGERRCVCVAKSIRPDRRNTERVRRRLLREGRLLATLSHPHLVRAYAIIRHPEPVVVLETLTGPTLADLVEARTRLSITDLAELGCQLSSVAHYLHAHGYLHLDLNPSNVLAQCGTAKLIDLSLARRPGRVPRGAGTREYLAPEQARGGLAGPATDIWGIGTVLYEAANGRPPFAPAGEDAPDAAGHGYPQLAGPPPSLRRGLPARFRRAVMGCLDPDPWRRPSADDLRAELSPWTAGRGQGEP
jgi:eukaryotic-like serine/threonine-protein kinase